MTAILDRGYVNFVEHWGSDERIIEAARMSTDGAFRGWGPKDDCAKCSGKGEYWTDPEDSLVLERCKACQGDEKLLRYLWENKHSTPFEMAGAVFEVQAPIFVMREFMRHRTMSFNELSGRYAEIPELFYVPSIDRLRNGGQSKTNKQGSGELLTINNAAAIQAQINVASLKAFDEYHDMLRGGLSRELARLVLPVNTCSRMRVSANLRNWLAFLTLRMDTAAQYEIRVYADAIHDELLGLFPRTMGLFDEGADNDRQ